MGRAPWSGPSRKSNSPTAGDTGLAMSQENVEIVRALNEAFNQRRRSGGVPIV